MASSNVRGGQALDISIALTTLAVFVLALRGKKIILFNH